MNPPSKDIKDFIVDNPSTISETLVFATNLHISSMPDSPDFSVCLYDTGGPSPSPSYRYDKVTLQIRVRGNQNGYVDTYTLIESIKELLRDTHRMEVNSTRYIGMWVMSDVFFLGYDEKKRPEFTVNFILHRTA